MTNLHPIFEQILAPFAPKPRVTFTPLCEGKNPPITIIWMDGRYVGEIRSTGRGYYFVTPDGKYHGEILPTYEDCKRSFIHSVGG